jgi:hypothetical protein
MGVGGFVFFIYDIKKSQNEIKEYFQNSDYYFSGTIIEHYDLGGRYYRCIIVKPDSIYLGKIANNGYAAAYNKDINEVAFLTGFALYDKHGIDIKAPSYVIVDSKQDTVIYNDIRGDQNTGIVPTTVYGVALDKILRARGGDWVKF